MSDRILRGDHCRCTACGEYFNSTSAFDRHRAGPYVSRRCLSVDEMRAVGMSQNAGGWWIRSGRNPYVRSNDRSGDLAQAVTGADGAPRAAPVIIGARGTPCS